MSPRFAISSIRWLWTLLFFAPLDLRAAVREIATISTSMGAMEFELFNDVSPRAVANFKYLADTKFYDGTAFHRHIAEFMVQGGDPITRGTTVDQYNENSAYFGQGGPEYTIPNEPTTRPDRAHIRGVISMAKTAAPDSGGSQFFILFGAAPHLDNVHAPMGSIISGEPVLAAIEAQKTNASDLPLLPIVIHSIRVRSVRSDGTAPSRMRFQPGTISGLLRAVDRNQNVHGSYQLTVTSGGAFSARIQYYGRRNSFTGVIRQSDTNIPEADFVGVLDPTASVPVRVRVHARQTAASGVNISLQYGGIKTDGSDAMDASTCFAGGEVGGQSTLAERYTAAFDAPLVRVNAGSSNATPTYAFQYPALKSTGFLTIQVRPSTGLSLVTGRLQDNSAFTAARNVSNEGGRLTLPLFFHELQPHVETQSSVFPTVGLGQWASDFFNFLFFRFRMVGVFELLPKPNLPQPANNPGNYLIWFREPKSIGAVKDQIATYVPVSLAAWTPPAPGQTLAPFVSGAKAQLSVEATLLGKFQIPKTNAGAVFEAAASAPQLFFNPVDGTFRGSFTDVTVSTKPRRIFQGVLLQKSGLNKGFGFFLSESASLPVLVSP